MFKESLATAQNPHNLALLLQSYLRYIHTWCQMSGHYQTFLPLFNSRSTIGPEFARAARYSHIMSGREHF